MHFALKLHIHLMHLIIIIIIVSVGYHLKDCSRVRYLLKIVEGYLKLKNPRAKSLKALALKVLN